MHTEISIFILGIVETPFDDFKNDLFDNLNVLMFVMFTTTGVTITS